MKLQLTISLLASDRKASLERCLDSIRPILEKVPSELIIVFTGKDPEVEQAALRYTDQVVPFQWINDFSAARNAGLKRARGEWFLFIDDDEWFEDTQEICEFFLSGEYKNYGSACYVQRNYLAWDGVKYSDFHAYRMSRRVPGLCFMGRIHEELTPGVEPTKYFQAHVHHYGYVKDTDRAGAKTSRNIPLLIEEIRKQPSYLKNYQQLVKEYYIEGQWQEAQDWCRRGLALCPSAREEDARSWLRVYLARILTKGPDKAAAAKEIQEILKLSGNPGLVRLVLYQLLVSLHMEIGQYDEALSCGTDFEELLSQIERDPKERERHYGDITLQDVKDPGRLYGGRVNCASSALEIQDFEKAGYFLALLPWEEEYRVCQYYPVFDQWAEQHPAPVEELFGGLSFDAPYLLWQRAAVHKRHKETDKAKELLWECMGSTESEYLQQSLIREALVWGLGLEILAGRLGLDAWERCTKGAVDEIQVRDIKRLPTPLGGLGGQYALQGAWLTKLALEAELIKGYPGRDELAGLLEEYCQAALGFYRELYNPHMFGKDRYNLLPPECRFALKGLEALECLDAGRLGEAVRILGEAIHLYPAMTSVVRELTRLLASEPGTPTQGREFAQLAVQMKGALEAMISQGQYQEAEAVVVQLTQLLPGDLQLLRLRQRLYRDGGSV